MKTLTNNPKIKGLALAVLGLFLLFALFLFSWWKGLFWPHPQLSSTPPETHLKLIFKVDPQVPNQLRVYAAPKNQESITLSAFQLEVDLGTQASTTEIKTNALLVDEGWVFPLVKKEGETVKLSGFRRGNTPYIISQKGMLLATFTAPAGVSLSPIPNLNTTLFYAADALSKIDYEVENQ